MHKDGGESFTACEVVSQNVGFCFFCLNGWFGFGGLGSNMGELPSLELRFWLDLRACQNAGLLAISFLCFLW